MTDKDAFFWITSGGHFNDEAEISAQSAKNHLGDIPRFLFTHNIPISKSSAFTQVINAAFTPNRFWYYRSTHMMVSALIWLEKNGFRNAVYMDTDTTVLEEVDELFDLPHYFDFSGARAPGRKTCTHMEDKLPSSLFPEINMGVNPMFVSTALDLWLRVLETYNTFSDEYGDNDQGPLRDTLIGYTLRNESFRTYILPPEYNCRFIMPCFLNGRVKILHGRNPDINKIAADINAREGMRLWQPYQLV